MMAMTGLNLKIISKARIFAKNRESLSSSTPESGFIFSFTVSGVSSFQFDQEVKLTRPIY